jgi:hypothetical protein
MFIFVVLIQVLLLNQIQFSGYLNPYFYVVFILLLPVSMPRYAILLLSFLLGFTMDIFLNSLGVHISATVLLGFLRSPVIDLITARESDQSDYPGIKQNGFRWFLLYAVILILAHHLFLFFIEIFTFQNFIRTFSRAFLSSVFSVFIVVLSQFLVFRD